MDEIIKEFIKFLKDYPSVLISIAILAIILYLLKDIKEIFFNKDSSGETFWQKIQYYTRIRMKRKVKDPGNVKYNDSEREEAVQKLLIHNFFLSVSAFRSQIPNMDFGYPKKSEVLRDVILIYITTIEKYTHDFITSHNIDELSTSKLNEMLAIEIGKVSYEIYGKMKERLGDALYNKLIEDPVRGFKVKNSIFKEIFINGVLLISSQAMSVYHYDNYERASEILTSMYVSLQVIVKNFEKVFKDYNGELDKYLL